MSAARDTSEDPTDRPNMPLVSAGHSDRCPVCGAHLAVDQRYCVECGTRRGAPRFTLTSASTSAGTAAPSSSARASNDGGLRRFIRPSSSASLLLGLLILLVALGIGVLIGHNGNAKPTRQPVSVVVNGGGSGASSAGASTTAATTGASSASGSTAASPTSSAAKKTATKKVATKAAATNPNASATGKAGTAAAAKSFSNTATKKSTLGGQCTAGTAGCSKTGKQTGVLF